MCVWRLWATLHSVKKWWYRAPNSWHMVVLRFSGLLSVKIWNKLTCAHKYLFSLCIVATRVPSKDESRQKYFVWLGPWNPQHTQKKIEILCEWLLNCYGQQNWKPQYQDCVWNLIKVCCSPYLHCRCLMNLMNLSAAWGLHLEIGGGGGREYYMSCTGMIIYHQWKNERVYHLEVLTSARPGNIDFFCPLHKL